MFFAFKCKVHYYKVDMELKKSSKEMDLRKSSKEVDFRNLQNTPSSTEAGKLPDRSSEDRPPCRT